MRSSGYGQPALNAIRNAITSEKSNCPIGTSRSATGSIASNAFRNAMTSEKSSTPNGTSRSAIPQSTETVSPVSVQVTSVFGMVPS